ncbi:MAG: hypothetical protein ACFB0C_18505 [Leptolyngbyaceae cyanobacterium]
MGAPESDSLESPFERLQTLLLEPQFSDLRQRHHTLDQQCRGLEQKLSQLAHQVSDPTALNAWLRPVIVELLKMEVAESRQDFSALAVGLMEIALTSKIQQEPATMAAVLAPIMPNSIALSSKAAPEAMGQAIAPNLSRALTAHIKTDRDALIKALAPAIGPALKAQIRLEQDAVVDALYPVIGNTISRYFAELLKEINDKLEQTLSFETVTRKYRARLQGISEAELLLREATPIQIQAVFLIHKPSGLVIAEAQPKDRSPLESDMIAGMLTAIRSFVQEYVAQPERAAELREIEYGDAQICLEEAGYCYLAVVVQGNPSRAFLRGLNGFLAQLVNDHGRIIQDFEGVLADIPEAIPQGLQQLISSAAQSNGKPPSQSPGLLRTIAGVVLILLIGWGGYWGFGQYQMAQLTAQLNQQLRQDSALALYRLEVEVGRNQLLLKGYVPSEDLAKRAIALISAQTSALPIENQVVVIQTPPPPSRETLNPKDGDAAVRRTARVLNEIEGIFLSARFENGVVQIDSVTRSLQQVKIIDQAFQDIPGVTLVQHTTRIQ